jgi:hypothetical protein
VGEEEDAVDVTGGVAVPVTVGVGDGVGVGLGAGGCGVGDGSGRGLRVGKTTGVGIGSGTGLATLTGGDVAPGPERGRDWTSVLTVGSNCPDAAGGPAAVFTAPPDVIPRVARSLRLPGTTWRPTASTCDGAGELGSVSGRSAIVGLAASEEGPAIAIICGAPGGAPGRLPRPMYAATRKRLAAMTATIDVFMRIPPDAVKSTPSSRSCPRTGPAGRN